MAQVEVIDFPSKEDNGRLVVVGTGPLVGVLSEFGLFDGDADVWVGGLAGGDGMELGIELGNELGTRLGMELGVELGIEVGVELGIEVGVELGIELGNAVGDEVRATTLFTLKKRMKAVLKETNFMMPSDFRKDT